MVQGVPSAVQQKSAGEGESRPRCDLRIDQDADDETLMVSARAR
jgi:hypothetical protein